MGDWLYLIIGIAVVAIGLLAGLLASGRRRTAVPMVVVLAGTVFVGLAIAQWLPQARTLPQALQLMLA